MRDYRHVVEKVEIHQLSMTKPVNHADAIRLIRVAQQKYREINGVPESKDLPDDVIDVDGDDEKLVVFFRAEKGSSAR